MSVEIVQAKHIDFLRAEVERLQANLTTAEFDRLANEAEIERLRALLEWIEVHSNDPGIIERIRALKDKP